MPYLLLALIPFGFGLNPVIARALVGVYEPATLTFVRWVLSALLIGILALGRGREERWTIAAGEWPRLILLGALGMGFCSYAAYAGVQTAPATTVGLLYACTSALVAAVEIVEGTTRASARLLAGLAACFAGVAFVLARGDLSNLAALRIGVGELWAAVGTVLWAGYTLGMRRKPAGITPLAFFTVSSLIGAASVAPWMAVEIAQTGLPPFGPVHAAWTAALVLVTGVFAFLAYNLSIRLSGPVLTAASISLAPVYIAILSAVLLGEPAQWFHLVAIALVVGGLISITLARSRG